MKAEINNENKSKFFALYWGQNVGLWNKVIHGNIVNERRKVNNMFISVDPQYSPQLLLKPLSKISGDDAIEAACYGYSLAFSGSNTKGKWKVERSKNNFINMSAKFSDFTFELDLEGFPLFSMYNQGELEPTFCNEFSCDFLRSKGYALPWMGVSVEEMVEAGWIKLTEI